MGSSGQQTSLIAAAVLAVLLHQVAAGAAEALQPELARNCSTQKKTALGPPAVDLTSRAGSDKTMYIMPLGSLPNRLATVASAATLSREAQASLVMVWPNSGDATFAAAWSDLYQEPALKVGPFPSGRYSYADAGCTAHRLRNYADFLEVQNKWEEVNSASAKVLCVVASSLFVASPHDADWFYRALVPSPQVLALTAPFELEAQWDKWGQWVGIHACRTQDCVRSSAVAGTSLPQTEDFVAVAKKLVSMPMDGEAVPRFFIVSDSAAEELEMQDQIWAMRLTGAKSTAAVFPVGQRRKQPQSVAGLQEAAAQMYLLGRTALLIGTPGSEFTAAVAAAGDVFTAMAGSVDVSSNSGPQNDVRSVLKGSRD